MASIFSIVFLIVLFKEEVEHVLLYILYMDPVQYCKNKILWLKMECGQVSFLNIQS